MGQLFDTILYTPLFNLLVFLYNTVAFNDFGVAIILLTLIIRFILSPFSIKALRSQRILAKLQPRVKEIQEKFKSDPQRQTQEVMKLYKDFNTNPFSGCFLLLIQLPILVALYRVSLAGFTSNSMTTLYEFIRKPDSLNPISLGFINLTNRSLLLAAIAGVAQFFQMRQNLKSQKSQVFIKDQRPNPLTSMNQQMLYFFPLITIIISLSFPAGLPLYWVATTVFSIFEYIYIEKMEKREKEGKPPDYGRPNKTSDNRQSN